MDKETLADWIRKRRDRGEKLEVVIQCREMNEEVVTPASPEFIEGVSDKTYLRKIA